MDFVAALILGAGVLGGTAYSFLNHHPKYPGVLPADRVGKGTWSRDGWGDWVWQLLVSILLGIAAAAVVPVFLHATSSNLVNDVKELAPGQRSAPPPGNVAPGTGAASGQPAPNPEKKNPSAPYVFFGFCVLAAYAAQRFLQAMLDRVLRELEEQKKRTADAVATADAAAATAGKAVATAEEAHRVAEAVDGDFTESEARETLDAGPVALTDDEKRVRDVLSRSLQEKGWKRRTSAGIARDAPLDLPVVQAALESLKGKGLVYVRDHKGVPAWGLTQSGTRWRP
jgi:hypothetical protein